MFAGREEGEGQGRQGVHRCTNCKDDSQEENQAPVKIPNNAESELQ